MLLFQSPLPSTLLNRTVSAPKRSFHGLEPLGEVLLGLPVLVLWWLFYRWSPGPP